MNLPGGRVLVVRPLEPGDVDGLAVLYDGLDAEDRHRRFFSAYTPSREFLERMAGADGRGTFGLAAILQTAAGSELVAEASCAPLPNGDGELSLTVSRPWRGWLGPYLLDALLEAAASRGVPNLEADVLVTNGPMLALLHSRGAAIMDHSDWTVVRLVVGTKTRQPAWPGTHDRLRVLVEVPGGRWHAEAAAREAGLQLLSCRGPVAAPEQCPALGGQPCPLAAEADIIVVAGPADDERWRALTAAHACFHEGVPVWVELRDPGGDGATDGPSGPEQIASKHRDAVEQVIAARLRYERTFAPSGGEARIQQ